MPSGDMMEAAQMHDGVNRKSLSKPEIASVFREFDALWEMPSTPERRLRMEHILQLIEPHGSTVLPQPDADDDSRA